SVFILALKLERIFPGVFILLFLRPRAFQSLLKTFKYARLKKLVPQLNMFIRLNIYFFFLLTFITQGFSQVVTVINETDKQPIFNVFIFDDSFSTITNETGQASLDDFNVNGILTFQHAAFKNRTIDKSKLENLEYVIKLEESVLNIDEVVVSANQWEQQKSEVPNKILTISSREIQFNNPQSSADLIGSSDKVFVQKSQMGGGSPMIRGFAANRILLVVDGVRMNNAIYRSGNLQNVISLDVNAIENSEIILGPGSVIYGSDAIGGVIDFHTKKPMLSTSESVFISSNALLRYSSANFEKTAHTDFNIGFPKIAFLTSFTFSDYDDLLMGSINNNDYIRTEYVDVINGIDTILQNNNKNLQKFSAYNQFNLLQKIRYKPSSHTNAEYAFHYSKLSDVPRYDRLIQYSGDDLKYGEWYYGPQLWMMHTLNVNYSKPNKLFDNSKLTLAYQDYEESRHDRKYRSEDLRERTENVYAYSLNLDFDKNLKRDNQLFYGVEAVYNSVNSMAQNKNVITGEILPESTRYPDGVNNYTTLAAYLSYKENFSEKFTTITGLRFNYVSLYSTLEDTTFFNFPYDDISVNNSALNGSIGFVYKPIKSWQINLNLSSGFHAPNIDDMAKIFDSEPGNVVVPNENLKPEYAYNVDLGISKNLEDFASISITGFYTFLNNALVRRDYTFNGQDSIIYDGEMSKVLAIVNADKACVYGFNAALNIKLPLKLNLKSIINYTYGEDQDGLPLRHVAPLFGSTRISYTNKDLKASVFANYNRRIEYEDLAPSEQDKPYMYASDTNGNPYSPAWWTLNFMSSYDFKNLATINLGVENILDNRYRPYSSGIVAPGRNYIIGLRVYF
ncbi:MAG: TonB-dependent receptor, partial [Bacteroidales bacterium]|nr:TonB-dependent receptor [Bacteroidales bacterium]